ALLSPPTSTQASLDSASLGAPSSGSTGGSGVTDGPPPDLTSPEKITLTVSVIVLDPRMGPSVPKAKGNEGSNVAFTLHAGADVVIGVDVVVAVSSSSQINSLSSAS
ncbi:MAG: hypothetical protein Q9183_006032, partial [Haloplaca sp. 2 TL-2023]